MGRATLGPPPIPIYSYPQDFPTAFVGFHELYPWAYAGIVERARELKRAGFRDVGIRYLFEHQRYSTAARAHMDARPDIEFGLDNNFAAYYARLIEAREPDLVGFFRMRRTGQEIRIAQEALAAAQVAMEFD